MTYTDFKELFSECAELFNYFHISKPEKLLRWGSYKPGDLCELREEIEKYMKAPATFEQIINNRIADIKANSGSDTISRTLSELSLSINKKILNNYQEQMTNGKNPFKTMLLLIDTAAEVKISPQNHPELKQHADLAYWEHYNKKQSKSKPSKSDGRRHP